MDFHPLNIIINNEGKPFVIDWTSAQISDPRLDLAWTLLLMSTHGSRETSDTIRKEYERISGYTVEQLGYFDVAVCLRRLFGISVSFKHGPEKLGMRPGAEEMMKQHVGPLKKVYELLTERTGITIPETEKLLSQMSQNKRNHSNGC
jgi:aminoglycoside phosphotransferase (APT) family kinase protein